MQLKTNQQAEILLRALRYEESRLNQAIAEAVLPAYALAELKNELDVVKGLIIQAKDGR